MATTSKSPLSETIQARARGVRRSLNATNFIFVPATLPVIWFLGIPLLMLVYMSFHTGNPIDAGDWTLRNYIGTFFGFISGFRSVTIPLMLATPSTETIGVLLFRLMERDGNFAGMAALGMIMVAFTGGIGIGLRKAIENAFGGTRR